MGQTENLAEVELPQKRAYERVAWAHDCFSGFHSSSADMKIEFTGFTLSSPSPNYRCSAVDTASSNIAQPFPVYKFKKRC